MLSLQSIRVHEALTGNHASELDKHKAVAKIHLEFLDRQSDLKFKGEFVDDIAEAAAAVAASSSSMTGEDAAMFKEFMMFKKMKEKLPPIEEKDDAGNSLKRPRTEGAADASEAAKP